jgi:ABC-type thiamine transport system ATPase subunit
MKKVLNNTHMIYEDLLSNKSMDIFISKNNLFAHLKIDTDLNLKLIPITAKNNHNDLAEYVKILLALTDGFAIEELNTLGKAINDEIFI